MHTYSVQKHKKTVHIAME